MRNLITATQIDAFFQGRSRDAQELLPHLIRRLVLGSVPKGDLKECRIPGDDEIWQPGYDGIIVLENPSLPLAQGRMCVEMGVGSPKDKAQADYRNRSKSESSTLAASSQFLFITPHAWPEPDRIKWCSDREKDGIFESICVLDSTDLEQWLCSCPPASK